MFDDKDYGKITHGLMLFSVFNRYYTVFNYSKKLNIPWANVFMTGSQIHTSAPLNPTPTSFVITLLCIFLAQIITLRRCLDRIEANELPWKPEITNWLSILIGYLLFFGAVLIFFPLLIRILRDW